MGQAEIIKVLEKCKVPMSADELAKKLGTTKIKVCMDLAPMLKYNEVECIELKRELAMKFYNCKRKLRLYYL